MRYRTFQPQTAYDNWAGAIKDSTGVVNEEKLQWMSNLMQINENISKFENEGGLLNEHYGVQGPEAVPGMGPVKWPGVGQAHGDIMAQGYQRGSGDMPARQLAFAMNVAAYTVGLELLPVLPTEMPSLMFGYLDSVYAGNPDETQAEQGGTEIYLQVLGDVSGYSEGAYTNLKVGDKVFVGKVPTDPTAALTGTTYDALYGTYFGKHRFNGDAIIRFEGVVKATGNGATAAARTYTLGDATDAAPNSVLKKEAGAGFRWALMKGVANGSSEVILAANDTVSVKDQYITSENKSVTSDLVSSVDMLIPEFSKSSPKASDDNGNYTDTRAKGEKGTQNIISLRLFSTSVEVGEIQVLGELTRTQLKDLAAYGQDGMGQMYKAAQNELTQVMNRDILRTQFRLGVTSAAKLRNAQGINLNLFIGDPSTSSNKALANFGIKEFVDVNGINRINEFGAVKNAESNSSAENNTTRSRRILTRILAASNLIGITGRHGAGDYVVMNGQLATAIQDIKGYIVNPFENDVRLDKKSLYNVGTIQGGIQVYVDPLMDWNDNRILVGRKGDEQSPGLKLFIYTLGDSVETISEKAMAPKILVSSRYALVPCGFFPEAQYFTFAVNNDYELI